MLKSTSYCQFSLSQSHGPRRSFFETVYQFIISSWDILHGTLVEPGILPGISLSSTVLTSMTIAELPPRPSRTSSKVAVWLMMAGETIQQFTNLFSHGHERELSHMTFSLLSYLRVPLPLVTAIYASLVSFWGTSFQCWRHTCSLMLLVVAHYHFLLSFKNVSLLW